MKLSNLKYNKDNPRIFSHEKTEKLKKSIQDFPEMMELRPIIVDDSYTVLGGNFRLKALEDLGYKDISDSWVKKASELTEDQKREFIIKDNIGFGDWDWDVLGSDWDSEQLEDWGLEFPETFESKSGENEDELPIESNYEVNEGDVIELGNHILYCQDNKDIDYPECELVFSDPPYELEDQSWIGYFKTKTILTLCSDKQISDIIKLSPLPFKRLYVLDTGIASPTNNDLYVNHIAMLRFSDKAKFNNIKDGGRTINKIEYRKNLDDKIHEHEKPLEFYERFILYWSSPENLVIDPFAGSGACLIACERSNRKNISIEINPKNCGLIVQRFVNYMNENNKQYQIKINGKTVN